MKLPNLFPDLHERVQDIPDNFKGFVQSECDFTPYQYHLLLRFPERCSQKNQKRILKIGRALAVDLLELIARYRSAMKIEEWRGMPKDNPLAVLHGGGMELLPSIRGEICRGLGLSIGAYFRKMRSNVMTAQDMTIILPIIRTRLNAFVGLFDQYDRL